MQGLQAIFVVTLAFIIGVNCVNLENSTSSVNETESRADDKCIQKCGQDPSIMCIGNLTSSRNIICSCKDETEAYDKKSRQCLDRCTVKCGTNREVTCEGDQSSDETTICSCIDKRDVYSGNYCFSRCFLKCGTAHCTGDQTSDDTTICNCYSGYSYNEKTRKCERRCKLKCGNSPYVTCTGDEKLDETTICGCERDNLIFEEKSKTCIKRCTMKCGWDSNIKCEGDQKTDETTICGCRNPIRVYDKESQTCKVKCDCENGICEEDENGIAICRCLPEYGRVSDVRCEECGCGKGANCTFESSSQKKKCICREGYSEVNGTCKGDCSRSPCKNGGTCRIEAEDITCNCMQDFSGEFCEEKDKCVEKCGKDPGVVCIGDLTLAEKIICSCRDETETYDEKSHQCIDRCVKKCGDDLAVECEGDQKTAETTICSCKNKTLVYSSYDRKCKGRCAVKCGIMEDVQCEGDQTSDETTICGCANKKYVYKSGWCFSRCFIKCGSVLCTGNQTSDDTTICDCRYSQTYDEKSGRCEDRCKVKCGSNMYVTCKGNKLSDETTICGCNRKDRIFHEKSLTCIKRCTNKCGWDPNIKCEGDQTTDETTICGCRDPNRFYDVESQTCKVKCDCENGICDEDVNGIAICRCLPEYGKISNVRCEECGCGKGANCTFESSSQKKNCICREGYSVINGVCKGDCSNSPCKNGGTCRIVANDITCDCKQSFTGEYCEKIDYCDSNPCKNGGTCRSTEDNFECTCGEIYGGKDCSENIWCDKNGQDLCGNEKCLYNETLGRGYCVCENGSIFDESTKICTSVHCASHPCVNGGTCTDDEDTFKCTCPEYFGEKDCSENKVCDIYGKDICGNTKCIVDEEQGELNCICEDGKVFDWLSKECRVDQCASNPCKNGGSCVNQENAYRCICPITYSGRDCSENIWCLWYGRKICGEASCHYDDISRKASCICPSNEEFDKKLKTCKGVCNPNPCVHGMCINDGKKHSFCKCFGLYTGNFCNETITDPCTPNPCQNGGSCMVTYGSEFMCICSILYSGSTCEYGNKTIIIILLAALGAVVLTLVCCGVYCCKRNQKLKKMSSSTGIHHAPQTVMSPESLQSNVYPSAPRF